MSDQELLDRISVDPKIMFGKPIIKGTRMTVQFILNLFAHGADMNEILEEYDHITKEDIHACFLFATNSLDESIFLPSQPEAV